MKDKYSMFEIITSIVTVIASIILLTGIFYKVYTIPIPQYKYTASIDDIVLNVSYCDTVDGSLHYKLNGVEYKNTCANISCVCIQEKK